MHQVTPWGADGTKCRLKREFGVNTTKGSKGGSSKPVASKPDSQKALVGGVQGDGEVNHARDQGRNPELHLWGKTSGHSKALRAEPWAGKGNKKGLRADGLFKDCDRARELLAVRGGTTTSNAPNWTLERRRTCNHRRGKKAARGSSEDGREEKREKIKDQPERDTPSKQAVARDLTEDIKTGSQVPRIPKVPPTAGGKQGEGEQNVVEKSPAEFKQGKKKGCARLFFKQVGTRGGKKGGKTGPKDKNKKKTGGQRAPLRTRQCTKQKR